MEIDVATDGASDLAGLGGAAGWELLTSGVVDRDGCNEGIESTKEFRCGVRGRRSNDGDEVCVARSGDDSAGRTAAVSVPVVFRLSAANCVVAASESIKE